MTLDESVPQVAPTLVRRRFSVRQLLMQTTVAALFFASLFHENQWWRATLGTVTLTMIFNEVVATIYATGSRRAFAIGHSLAAALFPFSLYGSAFLLPFLLSVELLKVIETLQPIDATNYWVVIGIFWLQLSCRASGYLAVHWYRSNLK